MTANDLKLYHSAWSPNSRRVAYVPGGEGADGTQPLADLQRLCARFGETDIDPRAVVIVNR